jgi:hypothetical protein
MARISDVAVCCCLASLNSRVSRAMFVSLPTADELRRRTSFGAAPVLRATFLRRRALTGSPPALGRRLIASPYARDKASSRPTLSHTIRPV